MELEVVDDIEDELVDVDKRLDVVLVLVLDKNA